MIVERQGYRIIRTPDGLAVREVLLDALGNVRLVGAVNVAPRASGVWDLIDQLSKILAACALPVLTLPLGSEGKETLPSEESCGNVVGRAG
jgi:hypothetical protein